MNHVIWKLFSQTGNIGPYLLLKEIESASPLEDVVQNTSENKDTVELESKPKGLG